MGNAILWRWENYEPFGNNPPDENPAGQGEYRFNLRFPGQYFDRETGSHYNYFRDAYDPLTGRYSQSDPIGMEGGINGYAYVNSNPLARTDFFGLVEDYSEGRKPGFGFPDVSEAAKRDLARQLQEMIRKLLEKQQRDRDYDAYKKRCSQEPPEGLDKCETARWELQRNIDCFNMRKAWDERYEPGLHDTAIEQAARSIKNAEERVKRECCCK